VYREIAAWLLPTALATDDGPTLVATVLEELRTRRIVCPPLPTIERLGGTVRARARRQLWGRLADGLTDQQRRGLDQLLEVRSGGGQSTLAWLRQTAYAATTGNFPKLIDRLKQVRVLGIESERATRVHLNYWLKLAREGGHPRPLTVLRPARSPLVSSDPGCWVGCHFTPCPAPPCDPSTLKPAFKAADHMFAISSVRLKSGRPL